MTLEIAPIDHPDALIYRIGLCGFDNPMRDPKTEEAKRHINQGVKIKMDEQGNILIKRLCKNNVYVKSTNQEDNAIGPEIIRNSQGALEHEKPGKVRNRVKRTRGSVYVFKFPS